MMLLELVRDTFTPKSTIGRLSVSGEALCETLELPHGQCIPTGRYEVVITHSPRLSELAGHPIDTPRLLDVPGHEGILIHPGNFPRDTKGCVLPGRERGIDEVLHSHDAYVEVFHRIQSARARGESVFIEVKLKGDTNGSSLGSPQ